MADAHRDLGLRLATLSCCGIPLFSRYSRPPAWRQQPPAAFLAPCSLFLGRCRSGTPAKRGPPLAIAASQRVHHPRPGKRVCQLALFPHCRITSTRSRSVRLEKDAAGDPQSAVEDPTCGPPSGAGTTKTNVVGRRSRSDSPARDGGSDAQPVKRQNSMGKGGCRADVAPPACSVFDHSSSRSAASHHRALPRAPSPRR